MKKARCPFCRSKNIYFRVNRNSIMCRDCFCYGPLIKIRNEDTQTDVINKAWAAWDTRVCPVCIGNKEIPEPHPVTGMEGATYNPCPMCKGKGMVS